MDKFNYICTYAYVRSTSALKSASEKLKNRVNKVVNDESGMEIIAVIIILAIVLAIAVIFRDQIQTLVGKIFGWIDDSTNELNGEAAITTAGG